MRSFSTAQRQRITARRECSAGLSGGSSSTVSISTNRRRSRTNSSASGPTRSTVSASRSRGVGIDCAGSLASKNDWLRGCEVTRWAMDRSVSRSSVGQAVAAETRTKDRTTAEPRNLVTSRPRNLTNPVKLTSPYGRFTFVARWTDLGPLATSLKKAKSPRDPKSISTLAPR